MTIASKLAASQETATKVALVYRKRVQLAQDAYAAQMRTAYEDNVADLLQDPAAAPRLWTSWVDYAVDAAQRSVLYLDTLRQRGNAFIEHNQAGLTPVLHFAYETVVDGRTLDRPVNYAMVRILPPEGVVVDPKRRPYVIIDPRAGHGPGIGGFKDDSQVGVAIREGHPVYFVIFFRDPEPGQTLLDVCEAEKQFVKKVRELHPDSPKPAIVGNCQGGWAAMMLAAADPEDTGPIVINGAPMSYWGGAWQKGAGDNPMRYAGGNLGGTWLSSLTADLGDGIFDGAYLVENFENLNPANTFWDKYYHLYANVDTEPPRFLEFERWWGGFYLMNREEIEWITRNLFVGNKLWTGETKGRGGKGFDLRQIRSPIILFASLGDNITPPQQAFNWVADVYGSTEEIKASGQVIVGLVHQDIGHLGIFVSGKVAKKEHAQIVSVLKSIEALPPGLYAMAHRGAQGQGRRDRVRGRFPRTRARGGGLQAQPLRARRREALPGGGGNLRVQPARLRALRCSRWCRPVERVQRQAAAPAPPAARAALGDLRPESVACVARSRPRRWCSAQRKPADAGQPAAQGRASGRRRDERIARLLSRDARRGERGDILPALRQRLLALRGRQARHRRRRRNASRSRASCRSWRRRSRRWTRAAIRRRSRASACLLARKGEPLPLSRLQLKSELIKEYRRPAARHAAGPVAPRARRAGDHRSLRARAGARDAAEAARRSGGPHAAPDAGRARC